jgi:hypothetical protein
LTSAEWTQVGQFMDLLLYADVAQQAFSSDWGSTLHLIIPALETLHKSWLCYCHVFIIFYSHYPDSNKLYHTSTWSHIQTHIF